MYDVTDEVTGFYRGLGEAGMAVSVPIEEKIAAADWGLAFGTRSMQVVPGNTLAAQGFPVGGLNTFYRFSLVSAGIWAYDEHARLIGEHIYVDTGSAGVYPSFVSWFVTGPASSRRRSIPFSRTPPSTL
ncbi:hypothetical protein ABZ345_36550 [Lentzea sp. NPDC005914]|uniref:hypothetical protein n=1 Tax=Lentzea sp. NPDC005914 TaxID=3154572 RepID=UPI0033D9D4E4